MQQYSILEKRIKYFPASLYHSFSQPFEVEKASLCYYFAPSDPQPFLDLYNNVTHVGHSNPAVLKAVQEAYSTINIHTRYFNKNLTNYVERLHGYLPKGFKVLFTNSGSEANDLALQIALKAHKDANIGSFERSYHGTTWLCNHISHLTPTGVVDPK
jgi:4-aminobutyrate aminotransferase-like enzyme